VKQPKVDLRERTKNFALGVVRMLAKLPKTTEAQVLGRQLLRSGTSVGANYREAYRGRSRAEWSERAANDIDGSAAQGSGSESGEERINLLPNAVIAFVKSRRRRIGLSSLLQPILRLLTISAACVKNAMSSRLFLLASSSNRKLRQRKLNSNFLTLNWLAELRGRSHFSARGGKDEARFYSQID
jgi:hypothetical protein